MSGDLRNTFDLKSWKMFELVWMAVFVAIGTVVTVVTKDSPLNYAILVTGILCVVLAAKGNLWTYFFGFFNSLGYAYVSFTNGLYGDMGLNLFFFVPTNIIGFLMWRRHLSHTCVAMRGLPAVHRVLIAGGCAIAIGVLGLLLSRIATQNTPYLDATVTILSIAATLLMMWRYQEQWDLYIALNIVTIIMWAIRLHRGSHDGVIMMVMWTAFLVNSVYGWLNWKKGAVRQAMPGLTT